MLGPHCTLLGTTLERSLWVKQKYLIFLDSITSKTGEWLDMKKSCLYNFPLDYEQLICSSTDIQTVQKNAVFGLMEFQKTAQLFIQKLEIHCKFAENNSCIDNKEREMRVFLCPVVGVHEGLVLNGSCF